MYRFEILNKHYLPFLQRADEAAARDLVPTHPLVDILHDWNDMGHARREGGGEDARKQRLPLLRVVGPAAGHGYDPVWVETHNVTPLRVQWLRTVDAEGHVFTCERIERREEG